MPTYKTAIVPDLNEVRSAIKALLDEAYEPLTRQQIVDALPRWGAAYTGRELTRMERAGLVQSVGYRRNRTKLFVST